MQPFRETQRNGRLCLGLVNIDARIDRDRDRQKESTLLAPPPLNRLEFWSLIFDSLSLPILLPRQAAARYHTMSDFTKHTDHISTSSSSSPASMDMSSMHTMTMTFQTSINTPLFSTAWTPATTGQYAGTVIFLIVLAFIYRFLTAYLAVLEHKWEEVEKARKVIVAGKTGSQDSGIESLKEEQEVKEEKEIVEGLWGSKSWRWSVDLPRSGLAVVNAGVGYLLMLAVMTMNVGYFMAVLGGVFAGEIVWGRWAKSGSH